ncbi:MAG TPA: hypothetical protein PK275_07775 [Chitinophagaceae bacterium]|jgi:hypothetical protein|nr:hypothetical protein [Chitinophagaceae bacterium]
MKKYYFATLISSIAFILTYCCGPKNITITTSPAKITYKSEMEAVVMAHCSPCHIPANGGKKKAFDVYANLKSDIDDIIHRIELSPGIKGFMPFKKTEKLPDSVIAIFKKWKSDGLLEN